MSSKSQNHLLALEFLRHNVRVRMFHKMVLAYLDVKKYPLSLDFKKLFPSLKKTDLEKTYLKYKKERDMNKEEPNIYKILKNVKKQDLVLWHCGIGCCIIVEKNETAETITLNALNATKDEAIVGCHGRSGYFINNRFYEHDDGECLLWPSRFARDWGEFNPHVLPVFHPYQKVLVKVEITSKITSASKWTWMASFYSHYDDILRAHITTNGGYYSNQILPYDGNESLLGKEVEE